MVDHDCGAAAFGSYGAPTSARCQQLHRIGPLSTGAGEWLHSIHPRSAMRSSGRARLIPQSISIRPICQGSLRRMPTPPTGSIRSDGAILVDVNMHWFGRALRNRPSIFRHCCQPPTLAATRWHLASIRPETSTAWLAFTPSNGHLSPSHRACRFWELPASDYSCAGGDRMLESEEGVVEASSAVNVAEELRIAFSPICFVINNTFATK